MHRSLRALAILAVLTSAVLAGRAHAFEFDNAAAEHFFDTRVRAAIEGEYRWALVDLQAQARAGGTDVQMADVQLLKLWMIQKAFLYGSCFDRAIGANSERGTIDVASYSANCVTEGLRIADQFQRKAWTEMFPRPDSEEAAHYRSLDEQEVYSCLFGATLESEFALSQKHIFAFLSEGQSHVFVRDYHRLKECVLLAHQN
jgi:hypothetical protein